MRRHYCRLFITALCAALVLPAAAASAAVPGGNDDISGAIELNDFPAYVDTDTSEATATADDVTYRCNGVTSSHTVWYRVTPDEDTRYYAAAFGHIDTVLTILASGPDGLQVVACNDDDAFGAGDSAVEWSAEDGQTYYLMVGSYEDSEGGVVSLYVEERFEMTTAIDELGKFSVTNGTARVTGTVTCSTRGRVYVSVNLQQDGVVREVDASGDGETTFTCEGVTPLNVFVHPDEGRFLPGDVRAEIYVSGCSEDYFSCEDVEFEQDITLTEPRL
jgi:hypothetical protein